MTKLTLNGHLKPEDVYFIASDTQGKTWPEISRDSMKAMEKARVYVEEIAMGEVAVYGINTGFGALAHKRIEKKDLTELQYNLIRSHCTGIGTPFSIEVTRAIMLIRLNCFLRGHSGITPATAQLICDFLCHQVTPVVPCKGSVGASGDLAPLSHIALALIGEGEVFYGGKRVPASFALSEIGKKPAVLGPKDGLALINGTAVMAALGCMALCEAEQLATLSDISGAMTLEGLRGTHKAYDKRISELKPHPGQLSTQKNLEKILVPSEISASHKDCDKVQDPYSLRCIPQVHGAARQTLLHAREVISTELLSVTDNPLVFPDEKRVLSGGNFHGEALSLCMDYMCMGLAEFCSISERRIEKMMNPTFSELPHFLTESSGLNSGLMIAHVTAAALTSENKYLCHPASVDSIPTSTDKEDHVSMGVTAGNKLHQVLANFKYCLSIELLCNTQAIDFLRPLKSTPAVEAVYNVIRKHVPPITADRVFYKDIERLKLLVEGTELIEAAQAFTGKLL